MKCDLHVHSVHSGTLPAVILRHFFLESYSPPAEVYSTLRERGMDLVTLTDHDSIGGAEELRRYPDFFVSEEVTCTMPSGTQVHIGVYDITERQHIPKSIGGGMTWSACSPTCPSSGCSLP